MLQIDFLHSILTECKKRGIHTAVDTAGNVPWKYFEKIIDVTDLFLYDIKSADSKLHEKYTGVGNSLIIENLVKLSHSGKDIYIRIPFIPGLNYGQIEAIGDLIKNINIIRVEVLPYHKLGNSKYAALDLDNTLEGLEAPSDKIVKEAVQCLQRKGIPTFRS